mmetsp:Transcript_3710/g.5486  ORF Transcript_3710/g.5486 Transcript_3710/m.5486 type:complete len:93 (+) Transcript_3710:541-819(+)
MCYGLYSNTSNVCSFHGQCVSTNTFKGDENYYGEDCSNFSCFNINSTSSSVCSGHGQCISYNIRFRLHIPKNSLSNSTNFRKSRTLTSSNGL